MGGKIYALAACSGENGLYQEGDVGLGLYIAQYRQVDILWPNRTRTITEWPNEHCFKSNPMTPGGAAVKEIDSKLRLQLSSLASKGFAEGIDDIIEVISFMSNAAVLLDLDEDDYESSTMPTLMPCHILSNKGHSC